MRPKIFLGALVLAICCLLPTHAGSVFDLIAYTDQPAPGVSSAVFTNFETFAANNAGQVVVSATLYGSNVVSYNSQGIWTGLPNALSLYAREYDPVPGLPASIYYGPFGALNINANGQVVFNEMLGNAADWQDDSIWSGLPGAIQKVARAGDQAPVSGTGQGSPQYGTFGPAVINASGQTAFTATLAAGAQPGLNDVGIWSGAPGAVQMVARSNVQAPGTSTGVRFSSFNDPALSDTGDLAFFATLTNAAQFQDTGIWRGTAGNLQLLARRNQAAPGTGTGPWFDIFGDPVINNVGVVCFASTLQGTGATAVSSNGVWAGTPGNLTLVARAGNQAPGLGSGDNYLSFSPPIINNSGQVAFVATLIGPDIGLLNNLGVFAGSPGNLRKIAQAYDQAPGLQTGTLFKTFGKVVMDSNGRVAFSATLQGGVNPGFDSGIWAVDTAGQLQLVVWENPNVNDTLQLPNGTYLPFATNGIVMLGNRRTDFSIYGPDRIAIEATFAQSFISPVSSALFFAKLTPVGTTVSAQIVGNQLQLTFPSTSGVVYQTQYSDDLTTGNWQQLDVQTGTGATLTVTDQIPNGPAQRYYRVVTP